MCPVEHLVEHEHKTQVALLTHELCRYDASAILQP